MTTEATRFGLLALATGSAILLRVRRVGLRLCPLIMFTGVVTTSCGTPTTGLSTSIMLNPPSLSFTAIQGGVPPAPDTISITRGGGGTLTGLGVDTIRYGAGQSSGWLRASLSGTTTPTTLVLSVTTDSLAAGTYTATVPVTSSVEGVSSHAVGVIFSVSPPVTPVIALTPSNANFSAAQFGANPAPQTISVTNSGTGTLDGLAVGTINYYQPPCYTRCAPPPTGWLGASLSRSTAPATLTLSIMTTNVAPGTYTAFVPVTSAVATNSPQTVGVTLVVGPPTAPAIALSPSGIRFGALPGGANPAPQTISVTNVGVATLSGLAVAAIIYGAGEPTGWVGASLSGSTAPATLTLSAATGSLTAGVYTATVPVTSSVASNSPQTVGVTLVVGPTAIAVAPSSVGFVQNCFASPRPQTISVSNDGGGILSGLAVGTITYAPVVGEWLTASLSGSTAPATLTLSAALPGTLPFGSYTATVPLMSSVASNSPQYVTVTLVHVRRGC